MTTDGGAQTTDRRRWTTHGAPSSIVHGLSSMADLAIRVDNLSMQDPSTGLRAGRIGANRQRHERVAETMMSGRFDRWRPT